MEMTHLLGKRQTLTNPRAPLADVNRRTANASDPHCHCGVAAAQRAVTSLPPIRKDVLVVWKK